MSFTNLYYKRTAGTSRACFICYRPSPTVLSTAQNVDFIYVCDSHLKDPGFATLVGEAGDGGTKKLELTPDEIAKVKEEWEAKQKRKAEKAKEREQKQDESVDKDKNRDKDKDDDDEQKHKKNDSIPAKPLVPAAPNTLTSTHARYSLHRDIFAMRLTEHRKRRQMTQARELAPRLPGPPRNTMLS